MTQQTPLSPAARAAIDAHLDAVDRALAEAGMTRDQRRSVSDNVEIQILDMVLCKCGVRTCSEAQVAEILAQLDSPAAYARSAEPGDAGVTGAIPDASRPSARFSGLVIAALILDGLACIYFVPVVLIRNILPKFDMSNLISNDPGEPNPRIQWI